MNTLKTVALSAVALLAGAAMAPSASAALIVSAAVGGAPTGVNYVNFDNLPLGTAGGVSGGVTVSIVPDGATVIGAVENINAAPFISNSNGVPFGDNTVAGPDPTKYMSTGLGSIKLSFSAQQVYFGLLWGSVDAYNTLSFYNGNTLVGQLTGTDITAGPDGNQGVNGTFYVNILSSLSFDNVIMTSSNYAFEFDNVAYNPTNPNDPNPPVPEPATMMMIGLGVSGLGMIRRKKIA